MKAELIDVMGTDLTVVNSARVSFDKESAWDGDDLPEGDKRLIRYLAKHGHWTPFSHPMVMVRETVPIFVARQRFKHMVGFTYNEVSRRYVDDTPEFFYPVWRRRADNKKQGSAEEFEEEYQTRFTERTKTLFQRIEDHYNYLLVEGVAPEQARAVLPQAMYTSYYVTGSLAAWARAYKQRIDSHAQKEIQELGAQWGEILSPLFPTSWVELTKAE